MNPQQMPPGWNPSAPSAPAKTPPSGWWYLAALGLFVLGGVCFAGGMGYGVGVIRENMVTSPGGNSFGLSPGGVITKVYEFESAGEFYVNIQGVRGAGTPSLPPVKFSLRDAAGQEVPLNQALGEARLESNGEAMISAYKFRVPRPGKYTLSAAWPPGAPAVPVRFAVGPDPTIFLTIGLVFVGSCGFWFLMIVAAIVVAAVVWAKRSAASAPAVPAYGPPPGYGGPAGYGPPPGYGPPAGYGPPPGPTPPGFGPPPGQIPPGFGPPPGR
jgi:hypothetical protein